MKGRPGPGYPRERVGRRRVIGGWRVDRHIVSELARAIRGSSRGHGAGGGPVTAEEAEREAREVLRLLLTQPAEAYPVQVERLGLRYYLQHQSIVGIGPDELSVHAWDDTMWRTILRLGLRIAGRTVTAVPSAPLP